MNTTENKQHRIRLACQELEQALVHFSDNTESNLRKKEELQKIRDIKRQLETIKIQMDQLK